MINLSAMLDANTFMSLHAHRHYCSTDFTSLDLQRRKVVVGLSKHDYDHKRTPTPLEHPYDHTDRRGVA